MTRTIQHIPGGIQSTAVVLRPRVFSAGTELTDTEFKFSILDHRGLTATIGVIQSLVIILNQLMWIKDRLVGLNYN